MPAWAAADRYPFLLHLGLPSHDARVVSPASSRSMRVLLADDHQPFRTSLRTLLSSVEGVDVVSEVGDGDAAVAVAASCLIDVVVLDLHLPGIGGADAIRRIGALGAPPAVIVLSMDDRPETRALAHRAGAFGFVAKGSDPEILVDLLHAGFRDSQARRDARPMTCGTLASDHDSDSADDHKD
jgi:DNA-binding NarL/FixJ family response regulator